MLEQLLHQAHKIGSLLLQWREQGPIGGHWEETQLKTEADRMAHEAWLSALSDLAPGIPVLSEEGLIHNEEARPSEYFLIDPIDGTASYAGGFSGFVTQVAFLQSEKVSLSVVHAPALHTTWHAARGAGAFCNSVLLTPHIPMDRLILIDNYPEPRGIAAKLAASLPTTGYLESGSIGLKICRVADGSADLFVKDVLVRDWDLAAPSLILEEAGGILLDISGAPFQYSGSFEKTGILACREHELVSRCLCSLKKGSSSRPSAHSQ